MDTSFKKVSANGYEYDLIAGIGRIKSLPWAVERLMIPEILEIEGLTYDIVTVEVPLESTQRLRPRVCPGGGAGQGGGGASQRHGAALDLLAHTQRQACLRELLEKAGQVFSTTVKRLFDLQSTTIKQEKVYISLLESFFPFFDPIFMWPLGDETPTISKR